jgi:hypothetical protein
MGGWGAWAPARSRLLSGNCSAQGRFLSSSQIVLWISRKNYLHSENAHRRPSVSRPRSEACIRTGRVRLAVSSPNQESHPRLTIGRVPLRQGFRTLHDEFETKWKPEQHRAGRRFFRGSKSKDGWGWRAGPRLIFTLRCVRSPAACRLYVAPLWPHTPMR